MKKTLFFILLFTPLWMSAQQVIKLIPKTANESSFDLNNISKQTYADGKIITAFNNGAAPVEKQLSTLSKIVFASSVPTDIPTENTIKTDYSLYPMPVNDVLHLSFSSETNGNLHLEILSLDGRIRINQNQSITRGDNSLNIPLSTLSSGVYVCRITNGIESYTQQIIKE